MATHAEIAANLLRNAAIFFRDIGTQNLELKEQMEVNGRTYDAVADMVQSDPNGEMDLPDDAPADGDSGSTEEAADSSEG